MLREVKQARLWRIGIRGSLGMLLREKGIMTVPELTACSRPRVLELVGQKRTNTLDRLLAAHNLSFHVPRKAKQVRVKGRFSTVHMQQFG